MGQSSAAARTTTPQVSPRKSVVGDFAASTAVNAHNDHTRGDTNAHVTVGSTVNAPGVPSDTDDW